MMKRFTALFLCLLIFVFAAGCKKEKEEKPSYSIDIAYFVDMGKFPECDFKIGELLPDREQLESDGFSIYFDASPSYVSNGSFNFFYEQTNGDYVFTQIAGFSTCFGFETGAISIEITDVLDEQGIKYNERTAGSDELFFLPAGGNRSVIECKSLKHGLKFVFEENSLCAVLLG